MVYIQSPDTDPRFNLALEQYVFDEMDRTKQYFMLWQNKNAIIVGKYQNARAEINEEFVKAQGILVVRRLSGGGAVYHDLGNLNFTYIVDAGESKTLDFSLFCGPVAQALGQMGVDAQISGRNDILIDGRKFSGNSQYLRGGRVMHHGTLMFDSDLELLAKALHVSEDKFVSKGIASVRSRVTNIRPHLPGAQSIDDFRQALLAALSRDVPFEEYRLTQADIARVREIQAARYNTWEWNYGMSPQYDLEKKRRIEGCGTVHISMSVKQGVITEMALSGDFFCSGEPSELAALLVGCRCEQSALEGALSGCEVKRYISGLTREELIGAILQ